MGSVEAKPKVEDPSSSRVRLGELCLLFCFEGAGPQGRAPLAWHERPAPLPQRVGERVRTIPALAMPFENCRASTSIFVFPSYKEPTVDALAPRTDEGRE